MFFSIFNINNIVDMRIMSYICRRKPPLAESLTPRYLYIA